MRPLYGVRCGIRGSHTTLTWLHFLCALDLKECEDSSKRKVTWSVDPAQTIAVAVGEVGISSSKPITVGQMFRHTKQQFPNNSALSFKEGDMWKKLSYMDYYGLCIRAAKSFLKVNMLDCWFVRLHVHVHCAYTPKPQLVHICGSFTTIAGLDQSSCALTWTQHLFNAECTCLLFNPAVGFGT